MTTPVSAATFEFIDNPSVFGMLPTVAVVGTCSGTHAPFKSTEGWP